MKSLLIHILSVASALTLSLRYTSTLTISIREMPRYLRKSFTLALCYVGFVSSQNYHQATRAGIAAFLSCTYDVVTDWRGFAENDISKFDALLQRFAPSRLRSIVLELLERDARGELRYDGLERGIVSARCITEIIGSSSHFEAMADPEELGMALQVVDDILDYEADIRAGDKNCLTGPHRDQYIRLLMDVFPKAEVTRLFPHGKVLRYVIGRANEKALKLIDQSNV